jgi:hypothetical protein
MTEKLLLNYKNFKNPKKLLLNEKLKRLGMNKGTFGKKFAKKLCFFKLLRITKAFGF